MKIKVLGTAGVSSAFRSPCYLIDEKILVDVPNGCVKEMIGLGYDVSTIDDVLITHFHADHFFDVPFIILARNKKTDRNLRFYCGPSGKEKVPGILKIGYPDLYDMLTQNVKFTVDSSSRFKVGKYNVERVQVNHGACQEAYGYIFDDGTVKVGFTGDTSYGDAFRYMASKCNKLICECTVSEGTANHTGIDDLKKINSLYPGCSYFTTHMTDTVRDQLNSEKTENITVLNDLDELTF